jgi:hypothetical protein
MANPALDDGMHATHYIAVGFLFACMFVAAAKVLARRN